MRYVDNAGTSWPKPPSVPAAVAETLALDPLAARRALAGAHASIAEHLGIGDASRLWLSPSCTAALEVAIGELPWRRGEAIVTSRLEHHALLRPALRVAATRGVDHVALPYRPGAPIDLEALEATLRAREVRLVAITAASNVTGERLPLAQVAALARAHGARLLVDAAQVAGIDPLALDELGADLVTFAGHKGPLGPHGIGGLWVAPDVAWSSSAALCEIGDAPPVRGPSFCDLGSTNVAATVALAAGLRWIAQQRAPWAEAHAHARRLRAALRERDGVHVLGPVDDATSTPTVGLLVDRIPLGEVEARFARHDIVLRAGRHCAPVALEAVGAPQGTVRISFGPFNVADDVDAILAALDAA